MVEEFFASVKNLTAEAYIKNVYLAEFERNNGKPITRNWFHQLVFLAQVIDLAHLDGLNPLESYSMSAVACRLQAIKYAVESGDFSLLDEATNVAIFGDDAQRSDRIAKRLLKERKKKNIFGPRKFGRKFDRSSSRFHNRSGDGRSNSSNSFGQSSNFTSYIDQNGRGGFRGFRGGRGRGGFGNYNGNNNNNNGNNRNNNSSGHNNNNNNSGGSNGSRATTSGGGGTQSG
jgi:hypothetical protein